MPAVAGRFYPRDPQILEADVRSFISPRAETVRAIGCVVPHAGYIYSGQVAGAVFAKLQIPRSCIVLCPNHTGMGPPLALMSEGSWNTPLGSVPIDSDLKRAYPALSHDTDAHRTEHAIEVQLPFLQVERPDFRFVPITLGTGKLEVLQALGEAIAEVVATQEEHALIIASSDMNHYENDRITRVKDHRAIERILALDPRGLLDVVAHEKISMCGYGPAVTMLTAARRLGATSAELVKYATSGDVSGDREMVVGYAGILVR
jgi:AmmeMemoRadiSam system protein B